MNILAKEFVGDDSFSVNIFLAGLYQNFVTIGGNAKRGEQLIDNKHNLEKSGVLPAIMNIINRSANRINESMENAKEKIKGSGISVMIHDLKNAMTGVIAFSQMAAMILNRKDYESLKKTLNSIHGASTVAGQTIKPLLNEKIVQDNILDGFTGENQEFKILLGKALQLSHSRRGKNVDLLDKVPVKPIIIKKNGLDLLHVLTNIFINAFDAMAENGIDPEQRQVLNISTAADEGWLKIRIADNGIGMDVDTQKKVFDKGFSTKGNGGQGIGLYSCKEAIEKKLGGSISLESWLGQGTVFHIAIPLA